MKKYVLIFTILFTQFSLSAQTEYIDIAKVGLMGTSTMAVYSEDVFDDDLAVHKLNIFDAKDLCHWVKYTNLGNYKVFLTLSDDPGDTRKICIKEDEVLVDSCYYVDSFATDFVFTSDAHTLEIYVCKPNYGNDKKEIASNK